MLQDLWQIFRPFSGRRKDPAGNYKLPQPTPSHSALNLSFLLDFDRAFCRFLSLRGGGGGGWSQFIIQKKHGLLYLLLFYGQTCFWCQRWRRIRAVLRGGSRCILWAGRPRPGSPATGRVLFARGAPHSVPQTGPDLHIYSDQSYIFLKRI